MSSEHNEVCVDCLQVNAKRKMKTTPLPPEIQMMFYARDEAKKLGMRQGDYYDFVYKLLQNITVYEKDQTEKYERLREFWGV